MSPQVQLNASRKLLSRFAIAFMALGACIRFASTCAQGPAAVAADGSEFTVPLPQSGLPNPYAGASFHPRTPEESDYAKYLISTPMFPDAKVCNQLLSAQLRPLAEGGSVKSSWVTKPYLAWGGIWNVGAVVGPVKYLFTLTEAHVEFRNLQGQAAKSTLACFVQYANIEDSAMWRNGYLKYGSYMQDGHKKYISGQAKFVAKALPGIARSWESGIRYYHKD